MLLPGWAGAMGRQREIAHAGEEGGDGGENRTIGRAGALRVKPTMGREACDHHHQPIKKNREEEGSSRRGVRSMY